LRYLSFDANSEESAALEASTYAPAESDIFQSGATEIIYAIVNGRTGQNEPERQGLNSVFSGGGPSLDILANFKEISAGDEVDGWRSPSRASRTRGPALWRRSVLSNGAVQRTNSLSTGGLTL
jgi:hypothetical protein